MAAGAFERLVIKAALGSRAAARDLVLREYLTPRDTDDPKVLDHIITASRSQVMVEARTNSEAEDWHVVDGMSIDDVKGQNKILGWTKYRVIWSLS